MLVLKSAISGPKWLRAGPVAGYGTKITPDSSRDRSPHHPIGPGIPCLWETLFSTQHHTREGGPAYKVGGGSHLWGWPKHQKSHRPLVVPPPSIVPPLAPITTQLDPKSENLFSSQHHTREGGGSRLYSREGGLEYGVGQKLENPIGPQIP